VDAAGALVLLGTLVLLRRGAFSPRTVVQLREEPGEKRASRFSVMADGRPLVAEVTVQSSTGAQKVHAASGELPVLSSLRGITFVIPPTSARELVASHLRQQKNIAGDTIRPPYPPPLPYPDSP
jgi:hypothetical protein